MTIDHVAVINRTEDEAVRFYREVVGLDKVRESSVAPDLSMQLFSVLQEVRMLIFAKGDVKVEVFILDIDRTSSNIHHFCLKVHDFPEFLARAREAGAKVISAARGDKVVYFVEDFSGNLMEVKPG